MVQLIARHPYPIMQNSYITCKHNCTRNLSLVTVYKVGMFYNNIAFLLPKSVCAKKEADKYG
jgi:hypothetical protein